MSNELGIPDGNMDINQAIRWTAGYYDMQYINISESLSEDISLDDLLGADTVVRDLKSCDTSAGDIILKTKNNESDGYVTIPVEARERIGTMPAVKFIKKTGSVSGVIAFYQKINQG